MKKCLLIIFMMLFIILTGCDADDNNQNKMENDSKAVKSNSIICTLTTEEENVKMNQIVTLKFSSNSLNFAKIEINAVLDEAYQKYASELVKSLKEQFNNYDEYGISVDVSETSVGANVTYTMDRNSFSDFYDSKIDKSQIVDMFEEIGYTCE